MNSGLFGQRARVMSALSRFVRDLVQDDKFDYIVPIERKGTALVRSAVASSSPNAWHKIVSSQALATVAHKLKEARVLVIDDSVWRGRSLERTVQAIKDLEPSAKITVAAFMTHHRAPEGLLDVVYYRGLDDESYEEVRDSIVEYLQFEGSLLLDTEHLEIEMAVSSPLSDAFRAMAGWGVGEAVAFPSVANRVNCTIVQRASNFRDLLKAVEPTFAELDNAICKIRVITKPSDPHRFTIIPICYPPLMLEPGQHYQHPRMKWTEKVDDEVRIFHCVGLSLSTELLLDFVDWMKVALTDRVEFDYETGLGHLLPVFPEIDLGEMARELAPIQKLSKPRSVRVGHVDDKGFDKINQLAQEILFRCYDPSLWDKEFLKDVTLADVTEVAKMNGQPFNRASAAMDLLIDTARILPGVSLTKRDNRIYAERVFRPDGEIVRRQLIREALLAGKGLELTAV